MDNVLVGFRKFPNVKQDVQVNGKRMRVDEWYYVSLAVVDKNWKELAKLVNRNLLICSRPSLMTSYEAFLTAQDQLTSDAGSDTTGKVVQKTQVTSDGRLLITYANGDQEYAGTVKGSAGRGISTSMINAAGNLMVMYTDGTLADLGKVTAPDISSLIPLGTFRQYIRGDRLLDVLTPAAVGLEHVSNIPDSQKPVSLPQQMALDAKLDALLLGQSGGLVPLDSNRKIDLSYLPESILGSLRYAGTWDADKNLPAMPAASTANKGLYYIVKVAGSTSIDGNKDWQIGDWIISNGESWDRLKDSLVVASINGLTGAVTLADLHLDKVDNTADIDKPIPTSVLHQLSNILALLDGKADLQDGLLTPISTSSNGLLIGLASDNGGNLQWRIDGVTYTSPTPSVSFVLDASAVGMQRYDLLYGDTTGTVHVLKGVESSVTAVEPALPDSTIRITSVFVEGAQPMVTPPDLSGFQAKSNVLDALAKMGTTPATLLGFKLDGSNVNIPYSDFGLKMLGLGDSPSLRDLLTGYFLRYDADQVLTAEQRAQVRTNLGITELVRYNAQTLADAQKVQVRTNIGLDKVDNTPDTDKPISKTVQQALDTITQALALKAGLADGLLTPLEVTQTGLNVTLTLRSGTQIQWRIKGNTYTINGTSVTFTIAAAGTSQQRIDLIYADTTGTFKLRKGTETNGLVTEPTLPDNAIKVTTVELEGGQPVVAPPDLSGYQAKATVLSNISALALPENAVLMGDALASSVKAFLTTDYGRSLMSVKDSSTFMANVLAGLADMVGSTATADGKHGLVPAPKIADTGKFLKADGTYAIPPNSTSLVNAVLNTSEDTLSVGFVDLTTVGPTAQITCGLSGIIRVTFGAQCAAGTRVSFTMTEGATVVIAASDDRSCYSATAATCSWEYVATGLTPGKVYKVVLKYRADTGLLATLLTARAMSNRFVTLVTM
ncbi:minor tail protein [Pseudomonas phage vB_PpuM-Illi-2]